MTQDNLKPCPVIQEDRFWANIERRGPDDCWPWTGTCNDKGYGMLSTKRASHLALAIHGRPRPPGEIALHSCDNPPCCNPKHLRWGTDADNAADMVARRRHHANRKTRCVRGHPFSDENTIVRGGGKWRGCRECARIYARAWMRQRRSKERLNAE